MITGKLKSDLEVIPGAQRLSNLVARFSLAFLNTAVTKHVSLADEFIPYRLSRASVL